MKQKEIIDKLQQGWVIVSQTGMYDYYSLRKEKDSPYDDRITIELRQLNSLYYKGIVDILETDSNNKWFNGQSVTTVYGIPKQKQI